ncbi:D-alanyl-lipoteichoic acid biosynthesis protein DltD [Miniphocaeibacter massiliensis]|uniref:D-alanyl-lipoteichoic acid biosynthesis protein DltD n=1 Tax=Miniphocaeibacter massiliensis TaxID=2041841 RepID=UPI000C07D520|nr:D-alanyl-lipoteichoic acid biosynthesis protein DltD [Miniphocaeibacter massiliensis]
MKENRKLWFAIGPFLVSIILLIAIFISPIEKILKPSKKELKESSTSMSLGVLKGNILKNSAVAENSYIPFFGSSELNRINEFHPTVLARKYKRSYEPFLLGFAGTQSLSHYFSINSMKNNIKDSKIVFVISPQWFVKDGVNDNAFSLYYSPLQIYGWILNIEEVGEGEKYIANRLLNFSKIQGNNDLKNVLKKIGKGEKLSKYDIGMCEFMYNMISKEDAMFGGLDLTTREHKVVKSEKNLPEEYNFKKLDKLAYDIGKERTSNNDFQIANGFYKNRLSKAKDKLKGSQKKFDYTKSPEFSDFQMVLNEIEKNNIDPIFVITPVNKRWSDYTGLSEEMLNTFSKKITQQLKEQGFNNIIDFTYKRDVDYFMEDTIHIGWRGWLELDQYLNPFLEDKAKGQNNYKINNSKFLTKEWEEKIEFK